MVVVLLFLWLYDRSEDSKLDVSTSAGDLLQHDGTLDSSVLIGDEYRPLTPQHKRWVLYSPREVCCEHEMDLQCGLINR